MLKTEIYQLLQCSISRQLLVLISLFSQTPDPQYPFIILYFYYHLIHYHIQTFLTVITVVKKSLRKKCEHSSESEICTNHD